MTPTPEEIEAIARSIYEAEGGTRWGELYEGTKDDYRYVSRAAWHAARPGIRREALEEARTALYSAPRYDQEIFDSMTQAADGSWMKVEDADAAIRALKDQP